MRAALDDTAPVLPPGDSTDTSTMSSSAEPPTSPDDATVAIAGDGAERPARAAGPEPPLVAGYDVVRMIGQGGMGVVWEAVEHKLGRSVALKVHAGDDRRAEALWIEARLAARIAHPGIVPIHEVGLTAAGRPYYTMDLVEGTSLRTWMREGPLAPRRAASVALAVAEAIGFAHARGVVHCDLKPGNVMIDTDGRARVLDFGLAFATSSATGEAMGPVRGSPPYMSPEQIAGEPLAAATDVYSIGVVLYEMLTGEPPFRGDTMEDLLAAIALSAPARPTAVAPGIGAELEQLCLDCLEKQPWKRPVDGRDLARRLRLIAGEAAPESEEAAPYVPRRLSVRPERPAPEAPNGTRSYRFELALASDPSQLWPLVSNTERVNRAVGLPEVTFEDLPAPRGAARKKGRFRVLGMDLAWEEHPFEWVLDREYSVFRSYLSGPLVWLKSQVTTTPRDGGGTDLVHEITVAPRGALGVLSSLFEIQWKMGRKLSPVYRRMDEAALASGAGGARIHGGGARSGADGIADPFEPPHQPSAAQAARVTSGLARLAALPDRRFEPRLLERLREHLLLSPDKALERIRPYALADAWGERRPEVLDLLLLASSAGLVDIAWDLVCPACDVSHEVAPSIRQVSPDGACGACGEVYTRDMVSSIELIFRPHREVRDIGTAVYCAGSPARRRHVLAQQVLAPHERRVVTLTLPRADLVWRVERRPASGEMSASPAGLARDLEVRAGDDVIEVTPAIVRSGEVEALLVNETSSHLVLRLERTPQRSDSVTAAAAMTHPTFQGFFSDEVLSEGQHLRVSHLAFVAVGIQDRARLLRELGDAGTFARFNQLVRRVAEAAEREQGTVHRASFDGVLAAFPAASHAVRAALAIAGPARGADAGDAPVADRPLDARVAVHAGRCIAVARGARLEYFGETVERAMALLADAAAGAVVVSSAVDDDPAALSASQAAGVQRQVGTSRAGEFGGRRLTWLSPA